MRTALLVAISCAGCASIPLPQGAPAADLEGSVEVDACVVWGERHDRRMYEGVAELSLEPWHQAIAAIVLRHPAIGLMIVDPSFGFEIEEDLRRVPPWFRIITGAAKDKTPTVAGLEQAGIDPRQVRVALLTHAHWDHTGGVRDLPKAEIRMSQVEADVVQALDHYLVGGMMRHHLERAMPRVKPFDLDGPPMLRFEASKDLFNDGAVIALPLPGHTPGSTAYLVRGRGGKRWLFSGDTTWTLRGIEKPAHKMVPVIDQDRAKTGEAIGRLHVLSKEHPEIVIVPAHDAAALELLPTCAPAQR